MVHSRIPGTEAVSPLLTITYPDRIASLTVVRPARLELAT